MIKYYLYPHFDLQWKSSKNSFILSLPWVSLQIDITKEDENWVKNAIDLLKTAPDHYLVQRFLRTLKDYTVCYQGPRSLAEQSGIEAKDNFSISKPQGLEEDLSFLLPNFIPNFWKWDEKKLCSVSHIKDSSLHDPITVITYLRGFQLTSEAETDKERQELPLLLDQLRQKNETAFFEIMAVILRQTHHITQFFQKYMPLSLSIFHQAQAELTDFIKEEKGHDKLMKESLEAIGYKDPFSLPVLEPTRLITEAFKKAIESSALALTSMIGLFEGDDYEQSDPLADVLRKSSVPKSAHGYDAHFLINKNSHHNKVIDILAEKLPAQSRECVVLATRLLEIACFFSQESDRFLVCKVKELLRV